MLLADHLCCTRGERALFSDLSFQVGAGELLFLQGKNGAGKTTLLRLLAGLCPPESGCVSWRGDNIRDLAEDYYHHLFYLGHQNAIKEELTPLENLQAMARLTAAPIKEDVAMDALSQVGLFGKEDMACKYLSQGQKRRVALARLIGETRPLWVLDEPFVALDVVAVEWLATVIAGHLKKGGLSVLTTHQSVSIAADKVHELRLA